MSDDIDTQDLQPTVAHDEEPKRLHVSSLSDEQLAMVASAWDKVKQSETPMADLRGAMSDSGLFEFIDKYHTNNIELRTIASLAQTTLEERHGSPRSNELKAILDAVKGKATYAEKRAALSDLVGFRVIYDMTNAEIDTFIDDAESELAVLTSSDSGETQTDTGRTTNRELADQVADLLDGQLAVNAADRVHYGSGATAMGKKVGGQFAPNSQLRDIVAHADQIREGLNDRGTPDSDETPSGPEDSPEETSTPEVSSDDVEVATDNKAAEGENISDGASEPVVQERMPLTVSFVDQTHDALAAARDAAEARRRNELGRGGRFKRIVKSIWMGENGLAGSYYLEKYKKEALSEIHLENDILSHESHDLDARSRAQLATIERFGSEYEESIHTDAGERRVELEGDSEFSHAIKDLLRKYASGEIADLEALNEERGRIVGQLPEALIGEGKVRIDNLTTIAEQVKAMVDHGESLDRAFEGMKIYSAEARSNVRSEAHLGKIERVIDRLQKSKLGGLVGPETIGVAAAVGLGVARVGRGTLLRAAGVTLAPGVLGGAFAAARESKRLKQERALHAREMAQGKQYEMGKRRDEIEKTRYETAKAQDVIANLESLLSDDESVTPEQVQLAYESIAEAEARIRLSDKRGIDLIAYSDVVSVEQERRQLDEARALAKVRLTHHLGELPDEFRTRFGIVDGDSANEALGRYTGAIVDLDVDIDAKDKAYRSLRRRRVMKAAAIGAGTSLVLGLGAQEILAFASPSYDGLAEHIVNGGSPSQDGHQTVLEGMFHGQTASTHTEHITPSTTYESYSMGNTQHALELPSGYMTVGHPDGTLTIEGPKGFKAIDGITLQKDGALTPQSLSLLKEHNISVADTGHMVTHDASSTRDLTVAEYNQLHVSDTTHVARDFWYDNNTAQYDKNELGLQWGNDGTGVSSNGNVQMTVSHMTQGGSSHGFEHTSWSQDASDGKLKLAVSASQDTQSQVYFVDVRPDGTIDIPQDSPAAKFFSVNAEGHAEFHGAYAEVVEVRGETNGVTHIAPLATEVGSNSLTHISDTVTTTTQEYIPHVKLTPPAIESVVHTQGRAVEGFGMPGFVPRRPLEQIRREARGGYGYNYNYGYNQEGGFEEKWRQERSPRLKRDPDADLSTGQELSWYQKEQEKKRGAQYIDEINQYIDQSKPLYELGDETKAIVCIPVAAANESDNIYRTLSMFGRQDVESQKESVILLNVNWKKSLENDPAQAANIQKTKDEIERARRDFPNLRIASFDKVWSDQFVAEKNGKIYGEVIKVLYDTAAFSMDKAVKEGRRSALSEAVLITNDADTEGMSSKYLKNYIRALEQNPKQDAFTGIIRRGVSSYKDYPGYGFVSNFYANTTMAMIHHQQRGGGGFSTDGPNSGIRMSMYAAMGGVEDQVGAGADGMLTHRMSTVRRSEGDRTLWHRIRRTEAPKGSERVMGKLVAGASLDTLPDRLLGAYRQGKWIASGWDGFDNGGYESREAVAQAGTVGPENPAKDIDAIAKRIETSIEAFGSRWWRNPSAIATSLRTTFGPNKPGEELYEYQWDLSKSGDGAFTFHFTDKGKEQLKKRMLFDRKGNPSQFGERMRHHLYDKLKTDKQPILLS